MFLLIDYILYRLQLGKYSVECKRDRHPINLSWEGEYEQVLEEVLASGDVIFCANNNSFISWLVQYFTKTDISHTGVYIGNGKVLHATLSGTRIDHLSTFFGRGCHVIPVRMQDLIEKPEAKDEEPDLSEYVGHPYPLKSIILRGFLYMFGIPWRKFRFTYIFDLVLLFSIFSVVAFGAGFLLPAIIISSIYLLIVLLAFLSRNKLKIPISDPGEGFYYLPPKAKAIPCVKKMNEKWFLNKMEQAISREN